MANDEERAEAGDGRAGARASNEPREGQIVDVVTIPPRGETNEAAAARVETSLAQALRNRPGLMEDVVDVIAKGLKAEKVHYCLVTKKWKAEPDYKERREMAKLAAAYMEGLPAQTVVNVNANASASPRRLAEVLRSSPNARRVVEGLLSRIPSAPVADQESPIESAPSAPSVAPAEKA